MSLVNFIGNELSNIGKNYIISPTCTLLWNEEPKLDNSQRNKIIQQNGGIVDKEYLNNQKNFLKLLISK